MALESTRSAPMLSDIMRQPAVLRGLHARRAEFTALGREHLSPGKHGRIFGFGCGDGWFAARAVAGIAAAAFDMPLSAATSLEMLVGPAARLRADDRAVAISMSGSVDRTNEAAAAVMRAGGGCIALTNESGGQLGRIAGRIASLHVPDVAPFLTGTARYTATVLGLMMLLEGVSGTAVTAGAAMQALLDGQLEAAVAEATCASQALAPLLVQAEIGGIRVLGAGADWAAADYGAAKLVKLVDVPVWSGEIEEFAHSQFWSARKSELVILLAGTPEAASLAQNTADALGAAGMVSLAIETAGVAVPSATYRIILPATPSWLAPLVMPVPLQVFSYHLALAFGRDPDASQDIDDPARFRAAQMLSRRCELLPAA